MKRSPVNCEYCGNEADLVSGDVVYPHRKDLKSKQFYICRPCGAWVGCHKGTTNPLGRLANAELRAAKQRAHAAFDPLWKRYRDKKSARVRGYKWLAGELGIDRKKCHIGMFDTDMCQKVVEICAPYNGGAR